MYGLLVTGQRIRLGGRSGQIFWSAGDQSGQCGAHLDGTDGTASGIGKHFTVVYGFAPHQKAQCYQQYQ